MLMTIVTLDPAKRRRTEESDMMRIYELPVAVKVFLACFKSVFPSVDVNNYTSKQNRDKFSEIVPAEKRI